MVQRTTKSQQGTEELVCAALPTTLHLSSHPVISTNSVEKYNPKTLSSTYYLFQPPEFFYFASLPVVHSLLTDHIFRDRQRQTDLGSLCPCKIGRETLIPICMLKIPHRLHLHDGLCCRLCCVPPSSQTPLNAHIFTLASLKVSPSSGNIPVPPKPSP